MKATNEQIAVVEKIFSEWGEADTPIAIYAGELKAIRAVFSELRELREREANQVRIAVSELEAK